MRKAYKITTNTLSQRTVSKKRIEKKTFHYKVGIKHIGLWMVNLYTPGLEHHQLMWNIQESSHVPRYLLCVQDRGYKSKMWGHIKGVCTINTFSGVTRGGRDKCCVISLEFLDDVSHHYCLKKVCSHRGYHVTISHHVSITCLRFPWRLCAFVNRRPTVSYCVSYLFNRLNGIII